MSAVNKKLMKFAKSLTMGIVGMPNVGKSLLFNLLSHRDLAETANYPFCTKDPNIARVEVPDERFDHLCKVFKPKSKVPASLSITDIAGLVRGASTGEGLGNEFLANIRAVNGIYQVVRVFEDASITHVEATVDPVRDMEIIQDELRQKDLEWVTKIHTDMQKKLQTDPRKYKDEFEMCTKVMEYLQNERRPIRVAEWNAVETEYISTLSLLTSKPTIFLLNLDEKSFVTKRNRWLPKIAQWIKDFTGEPAIPFSASFERNFANLEGAALAAKEEELGAHSMLNRIIRTGFQDLGLMTFFTCGADEVRGWVCQLGATAPVAAGIIHTDFQTKFIRAMVYNYEDLKEHGTESGVKAAGKLRTEGKNYLMKDGDCVLFMHGAGGSKKK